MKTEGNEMQSILASNLTADMMVIYRNKPVYLHHVHKKTPVGTQWRAKYPGEEWVNAFFKDHEVVLVPHGTSRTRMH